MCSLVLFLFFFLLNLFRLYLYKYIHYSTYTVDGNNYHIFFSCVLVKPRIFIIFYQILHTISNTVERMISRINLRANGKERKVYNNMMDKSTRRANELCRFTPYNIILFAPIIYLSSCTATHKRDKKTRGSYTSYVAIIAEVVNILMFSDDENYVS